MRSTLALARMARALSRRSPPPSSLPHLAHSAGSAATITCANAAFLDMPVMQQPEAYLGHVSDEKFGADGEITDPALAKLLHDLGHAFAGWVGLIRAGRNALAPDPAGSGGA
jgi:hypothetical protein